MGIMFLWRLLAARAAWGAHEFARRDPRSRSWTKIVLACLILLLTFVAIPGSAPWFGEGVLAHIILFIVWPLAAIGTPLCVGSIVGTLIGLYRWRKLS